MARLWLVGVAALTWSSATACKKRGPAERATDELGRVAQIAEVMPEIRRLSMDTAIPAGRQTAQEFRAVVKHGIAEQPHAGDQATVLSALGLIDAATDVARAVEDAWVSQAAAYYNPRSKKFELVMAPTNELMFDTIVSHELTHGLQDQHFNLTTYIEGSKDQPLDADAQIARRFVVEGDASLASLVYVVYSKTNEKELRGEQVKLAREQFGRLAAMDSKAMGAALEQQLAAANIQDDEIRRSMAALPNIPAAILEPFLRPYMQGVVMVLDAYADRGWRGVDALYKNPPSSTEQVLHPSDHLFANRDEPRVVVLPTYTDGPQLLESNVLGELMWSVYFRRWKHGGEAQPELGWDGDRYAVWRDADKHVTVAISTVWDSAVDAREFYDAYVSTLAARFPDRKVGRGEEVREGVWVRLVGERVLIVDGGPAQMLDDLEGAPVR